MGTYMIETYVSGAAAGEPDRTIARVSAVVEEMRAAGGRVRYLRAIFVPDDETCLLLLEAPSAVIARAAAAAAGLDPDRVARTVQDPS